MLSGVSVNFTVAGLDLATLDARYLLLDESNIVNPHCWDLTILRPGRAWADDTQIFLAVVPAGITIERIRVELDNASYDVAGDLKRADDFISLANSAVINDFDTISGIRDDTTISSPSVAAGKVVYLQFDSEPDENIAQMQVHIEWRYS